MKSGKQDTAEGLKDSIVEHVRRYRLTIPQVASQSLNQPLSEVRRAITSLVKQRALGSAPLYHNLNYVFVPQSGQKRNPTGNRLSARSVIVSLATLLFCCSRDQNRKLLTADEFTEYFPDLYRPQKDRRYFIDHAGDQPRLGFLRIDGGGSGRWSRILDKSRRDFAAHRKDSAYAELIRQGLFEIHIITPTARKALRVQQAIAQTRKRLDEVIQVTPIPELIHLMLFQPHSSLRVRREKSAPAGAGKNTQTNLLSNRRREGL